MNAQGYRVSPAEVEAALRGAGRGRCGGRRAQGPRGRLGHLRLRRSGAGRAPDEAALQRHCAEHLAAYKNPKKYMFVAELPRTQNGKIARRNLPEAWVPGVRT